MDYKISIIIPVRNGDKTLARCLSAVLSQNCKSYEVILVDNNSTDETKAIIEEFVKKDNRLKYFFEARIGRGLARNSGISQSRGDIIAMLDADCVAPKDWLTNLIQPIIEGNETVVMGSERDFVNNYWTKNVQKSNQVFIQKNTFGKYIRTLDTKSFAIKAEVMKKFMFDENLKNFEDFDLYLRLSEWYKIRFLPATKVSHYHKNSFVTSILLRFFIEFI